MNEEEQSVTLDPSPEQPEVKCQHMHACAYHMYMNIQCIYMYVCAWGHRKV